MKSSAGFTVVELLVYFGLLSIFMLSGMAALHSAWLTEVVIQGKLNQAEEQSFIAMKIRRLTINALITQPKTTTTTSQLEVAFPDQPNEKYLLRISNASLILTQPNGTEYPLTRASTIAKQLIVRRHALAGGWSSLTLTMSLNNAPLLLTILAPPQT